MSALPFEIRSSDGGAIAILGGGGTVGPTLTGINSITSATGQTLTLATLDSNANVILAPHGTGQVIVPIGSAAKPGIGFSGDTSTGIYSATGGRLNITLSGSDLMAFGSGALFSALDNTAKIGLGNLRMAQGFFGPSGIRIGDGTNGANITATGTSPNESLVLTPGGTGMVVVPTTGVQFSVGGSYSISIASNELVIGSTGGEGLVYYQIDGSIYPRQDLRKTGNASKRWSTGYFGPSGITIGGSGSPATAGEVTTAQQVTKPVTAIADATATGIFTITIPNANHSAMVRVAVAATLGSPNTNSSTGVAEYLFAVSRLSGSSAAVVASAVHGSAVATSGAIALTVTLTAVGVTTTAGATNTFEVRVTITRASGTSTNHTCLAKAEILNANASGITLA